MNVHRDSEILKCNKCKLEQVIPWEDWDKSERHNYAPVTGWSCRSCGCAWNYDFWKKKSERGDKNLEGNLLNAIRFLESELVKSHGHNVLAGPRVKIDLPLAPPIDPVMHGMIPGVEYVSVYFLNNTRISEELYYFKTLDQLTQGDIVVADTEYGLQFCKVEQVLADPTPMATSWIIQKIDIDAYKQRLAKEASLAEIKLEMETRRRQITDMQAYEQMAIADPAMQALLDKFKDEQSK